MECIESSSGHVVWLVEVSVIKEYINLYTCRRVLTYILYTLVIHTYHYSISVRFRWDQILP